MNLKIHHAPKMKWSRLTAPETKMALLQNIGIIPNLPVVLERVCPSIRAQAEYVLLCVSNERQGLGSSCKSQLETILGLEASFSVILFMFPCLVSTTPSRTVSSSNATNYVAFTTQYCCYYDDNIRQLPLQYCTTTTDTPPPLPTQQWTTHVCRKQIEQSKAYLKHLSALRTVRVL